MYDPIGGFDRIKEQFGAYLDTAFRVEAAAFAQARRDLLAEVGTLALDPIFEVVPRYEQWGHGLEELATSDTQGVLAGFDQVAKEAFAELALSGLFPSERADNAIGRAGRFRPYSHQIEMLRKGVADGTPGIVTSGTGSGKTESFLLPVLAQIAKEAVGWPAPTRPVDDDWLLPRGQFAFHRRNEHPDRPKALRAIVIYPLNALVEDQLVRLRKALDSPAARDVMRRRFNGNGVFFGRYTGATPVAGYRVHPRNDEAWKKKRRERTDRIRQELRSYKDIQRRIAEGGGEEDLRFLFPSTDGHELLSRWDIQHAPPDILVTNQAMLNAMMVREVDAPVFDKTRDWIERDEDARFFLVMDELHLVRGSGGAELAGLLRVLIDRLGLNSPEHRHKLRVLASSASLPVTEALAPKSTRYLIDMFGSGGTFREREAAPDLRTAWRSAIVGGAPIATERPQGDVDRAPLRELSSAVDKALVDPSARPEVDRALMSAARSLPGLDGDGDTQATLEAAVAVAASLLEATMLAEDDSTRRTPRTIGEIGKRLFGTEDRQAVRGLALLRSIPDMPEALLSEQHRPRSKAVEKLPAFRAHLFIRNLEGLFASVSQSVDGEVAWGRPSVERGEDFDDPDASGVRRRLFETLYCEACGDLYVGGRRGGGRNGHVVSLLPAPENLEKLPESPTATRFEDASWEEFALFWPGRAEPLDESGDDTFGWVRAFLDPFTGTVAEATSEEAIPGYYLHRDDRRERDKNGRSASAGGTAVPFCCARCGTDYSGRYKAPNSLKRAGRLSPIRSFRTGFAKTSQLLATELVGALKSQGGDGKLVAFSDSREDAANLALDVEVQHQRDLRREILVLAALKLAKAASTFGPEDEAQMATLQAEMADMIAGQRWTDMQEISGRLAELQTRRNNSNTPPAVPLSKLFEFNRGRDETGRLRPVLSDILAIGSNPVEGADVRSNRVKGRPWYDFFRQDDAGLAWDLQATEQNRVVVQSARDRVAQEHVEEVVDLVFSKTYFALEETGLGWPSFFGPGKYDHDESRLDAWLRILSDAYRVVPNRFQDENTVRPWQDAKDVLGKASSRLGRLLPRIFEPVPVREAVNEALAVLRGGKVPSVRGNLTVDVTDLYFRPADAALPAYRCPKCARVHLHRGFGRCTRCGENLPTVSVLTAGDVAAGNFLGRKVERARSTKEKLFRLKCEELTGQSRSPAQRLQQFRGVFVQDEGEDPGRFRLRAKFEESDLLSVTTTMEVGVDIGSLQAVYQGNMPPQRFNYQQRVGRAGRRGQSFASVLTVCRSKSHDVHYFRNPIEMTGAPPPPPFVTTGLADIPSRLLRKFWLASAFGRLRVEHPVDWPGDRITGGDIHGEFVPCADYFAENFVWPDRLRDALNATDEDRSRLAELVAGAADCEVGVVLGQVSTDKLMEEIEVLHDDHGLDSGGLATALAEKGLLPLYGMPTSSRDLYVQLEQEGWRRDDYEADWDKIDRDQVMALFDFAPGSVRTREKEHYLCVGFTGALPAPRPHTETPDHLQPFSHWRREFYVLGHCDECGTWTRRPAGPVDCRSCGRPVSQDREHDCFAPAAYRTEFRTTGADTASSVGQRITLASLGVPDDDRRKGNLQINFGERSEVFVVNPGPIVNGQAAGFEIQDVTDGEAARLHFMNRTPLKVHEQGLSASYLAKTPFQGRFTATAESEVTSGWLAARKITNSIQVSPHATNPRLRSSDLDSGLFEASRDRERTAVRAAAISATEMIVQRAALELDVAPEEFDILAPFSSQGAGGERRPFLQMADALANGSGFCRHLLSGAALPIDALIDSMLDDQAKWPRERTSQGDHRGRCSTSCYRCMQRFNNRNYHGLLDWRLGLSFLRAMRDPGFVCGLDGDWSSTYELLDWPELAAQCVARVTTLVPGCSTAHRGSLSLPAFTLDAGKTRWAVIVHPLWRREGLVEAIGLSSDVALIDTFEFVRRPLQALEQARRLMR